MPCCAIVTCRLKSQTSNIKQGGISFHRFPKEPDIRSQWIDVTGRENWVPTKTSTICSKHFREDDFVIKKSGNRFLKLGAIPHVNIAHIYTNSFTKETPSGSSIERIPQKRKLNDTGAMDCKKKCLGKIEAHVNPTEAISPNSFCSTPRKDRSTRSQNIQYIIKEVLSKMPNCILRYCTHYSQRTKKFSEGVTFHKFPRPGHEKREEWIKFVQNNRSEDSWLPSEHTCICSVHFREQDINVTKTGRRFLKKDAVPIETLKLSKENLNTSKTLFLHEHADAPPASTSQDSNASTSQQSKGAAATTTDDDASGDAERGWGAHTDGRSMDSNWSKLFTKEPPNVETTPKVTCSSVADKSFDIHEGFSCNVCNGIIVGFRYTCVQCNFELCISCEARGEHSLHYMLRIPRPAPFAEVDAVLRKIRAHLLSGLDTEQAEQQTDDRVVPALSEVQIKVEIKEELLDPLECDDKFQPDDSPPESEYMTESTLKEQTLPIVPANTSSTEGFYAIIENPNNSTQITNSIAKPKAIKHDNNKEPEHGSEKRIKMHVKEETQANETMMEISFDTAEQSTEGASVYAAGPATEGVSVPLMNIVKSEVMDDEGSFEVLSYNNENTTKTQPATTGKNIAASSRKKKVVQNINIDYR